MAFGSFGILLFTLVVNEFRHLIGFAKGYAPHNFAFNFGFFIPSIYAALGLAFAVIVRTIKHWKS